MKKKRPKKEAKTGKYRILTRWSLPQYNAIHLRAKRNRLSIQRFIEKRIFELICDDGINKL